jgi:hypothetical protein
MMKKEGLSSIEDAEAKGLTIPQGVVFSPAISADICEGLSRVSASIPGISPKEAFNFKYGLASLRVPASHRLRNKGKIPESVGDFWFRVLPCPEKMGMVGRVLKHQLACGFVSNSTHFQNIYDAPHSICPHADSADLIPISEILREADARKLDRDEILESLVLGQLCYMPFNLMLKYKGYPPMQRAARAAIHTILSTVAPEAFNFVEREVLLADFTRKPYSVLSSIAKRLIQEKMVLTDPQVDWQKMRDDHADIGYDGVAVQMVELALDDAIRYAADVQKAERSLNRQRD